MSDLLHVSPAASAAPQKSNAASKGLNSSQDEKNKPSEFSSMYDNYVESEQNSTDSASASQTTASAPVSTEQQNNKPVSVESENLPQQSAENGNALPGEDTVAMWQALMALQPAETAVVSGPVQLQPDLVLGQHKKLAQQSPLLENALPHANKNLLLEKQPTSLLNSSLLDQDYYQSLLTQKQGEAGVFVAAGTINPATTQLAAAHFTPGNSDAVLFSMDDQLAPTQGINFNSPAGLSSVGLAAVTQAATMQTHLAPLNLGQNAWEANLGSRLQMMVGQNIQTAEIRLDPPELGALDIKIKVNNDVASVNITSPHSHVREALESAVPKLREMFAESGVALGDVNVGQGSNSEQQQASEGEAGSGILHFNAEDEISTDPVTLTRKVESNGLLDIYA